MDFGRAFSYVTEDEQWIKKVLIGGVINLIPILNLATSGYFLELIKQVAWRQEVPLPEWSNLGNKWVKGLMFAIIAFIYFLPGLVLMMFSMIPAILAGGQEGAQGAAVGGMMIFMLIGGIYFFIVMLIMPSVAVQYALYDNFGAAFRFGDIIKFITDDIGGYIMALIAVFAAGMIGSIISMIPVIGWIAAVFAYFYAYLVGANAFGQLAQRLVQQPASPSGEAQTYQS